jgi:hypothetical protein
MRCTDPGALRSEPHLAPVLLRCAYTFQLLNSPESPNWQRHLVGAKRLVQARGPYRFQEELDSAILLSMCGPFVSLQKPEGYSAAAS